LFFDINSFKKTIKLKDSSEAYFWNVSIDYIWFMCRL